MKTQKTYYGAFFWIAILSFTVPIFVGWRAFDKVRPTSKPTPQPDASGVDHQLFDYLLKSYVEHGLIDYDGFSRDHLFKVYLRQLAEADPSELETDDQRLALHLNAYNAFVIHGVILHDIHLEEKNVLDYTPLEARRKIEELNTELASLKRLRDVDASRLEELNAEIDEVHQSNGFFRIEEHIFAGTTMSLDYLEHEIIRPTFQEPRIHVALVCAAKSCPSIRPEAYSGQRVASQLQDQAVLFANNPTYVDFDSESNSIQLSPILSWYAVDWEQEGGYLVWLSALVKNESMRDRLLAANQREVNIQFNNYDWTLNAQDGGGVAASGGGGGFGSGSVPNE